MPRLINLVGQKFGKWLVIELAEETNFRQRMWLCKCECGTKKKVQGANLRHGKSHSCGCISKELCKDLHKKNKPKQIGDLNRWAMCRLYSRYKNSAKNRGIQFSLTRDQCFVLFQENCSYCGAEPSRTVNDLNRLCHYTYNGIDRVDSLDGYKEGNIVASCWECNKAKGTRTVQEFREWVARVASHLGSYR